MQYKARIYCENVITDVDLSNYRDFSIGSGDEDDYKIYCEDIGEQYINLRTQGDICYISQRGTAAKAVKDGDVFVISEKNEIAILICCPNTTYDQSINLKKKSEIMIGRKEGCDLCFKDKSISREHAKVYIDDGQCYIKDLDSSNGTYVKNQKIDNIKLKNGDIISIGKYDIVYDNFVLKVMCAENIITSKTLKKILYPYFKRSPRMKLELPDLKIDIQNPPSISSKPSVNWLSVFMMPAMMLIAGIVGAMLSPYMLVFAVGSPLVAIINYITQRKKYTKEEKLRINKYREYLKGIQKQIDDAHSKQLEALLAGNKETSLSADLVKTMSNTLWERTPYDNDFISARIGSGTVSSCIEIKLPNETLTLYEDELANEGRKLEEKNRFVDNAPIICDIKNNGLIGIVGNKSNVNVLTKNILVQLTLNHSYEDLRIVTIFNNDDYDEWSWIRWLPHSFNDTRSTRFMACNTFSVSNLCKDFEEIIKERKDEIDESHTRTSIQLPYYLFIIADMDAIKDQHLIDILIDDNVNINMGVLFLCRNTNQLPKECKEIIEVTSSKGEIYNTENSRARKSFCVDKMQSKSYDAFARTMAPIRVEETIKSSTIPSCVTFLDGYGVKTPFNINITENWKNNKTFKSMAVPIGIRANGEKFYFDIHEKHHGPHGLVAGTTGSGKSEMVQSWILSMAINFSPSDVSFVLIDFKGTGLITPFENLPHLAGKISNIDKNIHRNLIALECELTRRQILFNKYGVQNISDYQKLYHKGQTDEALSALIIVIDEFAEFKVQFPEFMTIIDRIFAIGRTLGVFIILLTQEPTGVVSEKMFANTRFRWCLKVANSAFSKQILHHPDAAKINVPGRAYVQVGEDEIFEEVQSFWSGAPYNPGKKDKMIAAPRISGISIDGKRISYEEIEKTLGFRSDDKEIDSVVSFLNRYVEKNELPKAKKVWTEKLVERIFLNDLLELSFDGNSWQPNDGEFSPIIGLVDDPRNQSQYPAVVNMSNEGHIGIFGAPSTGKTTLLQTFIMSTVCMYSPEDVNIYIMDFNTWGMGIFKDFPHVGGIANDNEEEKIDKLIKLINKEFESRREKFAGVSVGSIKAYRETTGEKLPYIALIVDNFAPVLQLYPDADKFFVNISRQGGSYGIYLILTANNHMALSFKINQNIKNAIALQMTDKSDYASIVGKTNGLEPDNVEGRGLIKASPPLEFQTALPVVGDTDSERVSVIKKIADEMNSAWTGKRAAPIPIMPDVIHYNSVYSNGITIGLTTHEIYPIGIDFTKSQYMAISGFKGSGKSNMINVIAKQFKYNYNAEIIMFRADSEKNHDEDIDKYFTTGKELDDYMAEMVPELQRRKEAFESGTKEVFSTITILIDGLKSCYDLIDDKTAKRLEAIIRLGKGLNVYLIASEDPEYWGKMCGMGENISMLLTSSENSILLGGRFKEHVIFKSNLSYSENETKLGEYEGYLLSNGNAIRFKSMYEQ